MCDVNITAGKVGGEMKNPINVTQEWPAGINVYSKCLVELMIADFFARFLVGPRLL